MPIPDRVRYLNKKFTNRLFIHIAGKKRSFVALLRHTGRKSGQEYEIPILVVMRDDTFTFALTYGVEVDWYKNVVAAGKARLVWNGQEYLLTDPTVLDPEAGRQSFGRFKALILRAFGVNDFFKMNGVKA